MSAKPSILVVDDEPGMLRAVERILVPDFDVTTIASPLEALELAKSLKPDLVICDISMPKLDGFELMTRLKQQRPETDVILMTGLSEPDVHLVRAIREKAFYFIQKPFNRDVMRTLVDRCLELRRLRNAERFHARRMERELSEARSFQQMMLPPAHAVVEGVRINARYVACSELCGDIFDYASAGDGRAAVLVADVSGHGVSAALLTAVVKSAFQSVARDGHEPSAVATRVAENIRTFSDRQFITLIAAVVDRARGELRVVNAGHPPGLLIDHGSGKLTACNPTGPMLSPVFADESWPSETHAITDRQDLLLYTDGVSELSNGKENFSDARIARALQSATNGGDQLLDAILKALRDFSNGRSQIDDLTMLTARFS